jgi:flagellar hook-associated protein FlgK
MQLINNLKQEIEQLTMEGGKLQRLYQQRDELLGELHQIMILIKLNE